MNERPGIYLHFDLGLSWTRRQGEKRRLINISKRSSRGRQTDLPYDSPYPVIGHSPTGVHRSSNGGGPYLHPSQHQSRAPGWPSHRRGSSAPPEGRDNVPRDRTYESEQLSWPEIWKDLPATPSRFRLGEEDLPWSSYVFPTNSVSDHEDNSEARQHRHSSITSSATSNKPVASPKNIDDREQGRAREMESLATAMMTVDNGFEDQWWYQGSRSVNIAGDLISPTALHRQTRDDFTGGYGEILEVASPLSSAYIVSPVTGSLRSPSRVSQ